MLSPDSLVLDIMFQANAELEPEDLLEAMGGEEVAAARKLLDLDMQDPRLEMELSPSMPFRRRGERRLMIIDDSVAPMRKDPRRDPVVPLDLRPEKERLIAMCAALPVRLGRIMALGSWGDAVLVARNARDLRAISLLPWVLDPNTDSEGRRRANRLSQQEFEAKILAYDKRLEELDEEDILANLGPATFERRGDLLVVDVLEDDGTWDLRKSMAMEQALAAIESFSLFPGAPSGRRGAAVAGGNGAPKREPASKLPQTAATAAAAAAATAPPVEPAPTKTIGPPLQTADVAGKVVLVFPPERFDLDVAAALGKRDWGTVLQRQDPLNGQQRDTIQRDGAAFVAPLEFLSEVFVEGKPLSRPAFDAGAREVTSGVRAMEVHFPRFGPVLLLDVAGRGRFVSSLLDAPQAVLDLIRR
jgi:hypothetical protein